MPILNLKPSHKAVKAYYQDLETLKGQAEQASLAFVRLLTHCAKQVGWTFIVRTEPLLADIFKEVKAYLRHNTKNEIQL